MRGLAAASRGSVVLAGLALGVLFLVPSALPRTTGTVAVPPKSFNLWQGNWRTPYGTLALRPATVTIEGSGPRPGVRGTFSRGGTLVAYLSAPGDTPGNLGLYNVEIIGTYSIPSVGNGRFSGQTRWGEQDRQAYRAFEFIGRAGSSIRFRATFAGGGPSTADLARTFKVFGPEEASSGSVRRYRVRWVYEATLLGPRTLPYPGLVLRFRFSRPIRPNHYAAQGPNLSTSAPRNLQTTCNNGVLNAARNGVIGFDCNTYSLGIRGDGGVGWNVRASFEAIVNAGSGPISATISNTLRDRFARLPARDRTVLRGGRSIPKAPGTPGTGTPLSWTGTWAWTATTLGTGQVFRGSGMSIVQQGTTACASWPWSTNGAAKGPLSANQRTWGPANWYDAYGKGLWTLSLVSNGRFTGTQTIDPHGAGANVTARIEGTRTSTRPARTLDCNTIRVGP